MKTDTRAIMALSLVFIAACALAGAWCLADKSPFVALATLVLRELSAVRSVVFPTRSEAVQP